MRYIVNSREMKLYDSNTIEKYHVPSLVLMERAAVAFVDELYKQALDLSQVLVVCGGGNNGGDGYAIARLLKLAGACVDVVLADKGCRKTESNQTQEQIWQAYGNEILSQIPADRTYTTVIDAVFGVGLSRKIEGRYADIIAQMNELSGNKVAVDIASGISSDNGSVLGIVFRADITVTFAFEKIGCVLWPGNEYSGNVIVRDIGIDENSFFDKKPVIAALEDKDFSRLPMRKSHSNKGTYGKLLVIAGSAGMSGAAFFSAMAAYRVGTGLVRIFTPEVNRAVLQTQLPEAVLTTYSAENPDVDVLKSAMNWADAIVCGPGIGTSDTAAFLMEHVLNYASVPVLMDADALNLIARDVTVLQKPHTQMVFTPHLGEMSRLVGETVPDIQNHLIEVAEEFARQYNVICVLKDEHTVTCVPSGQIYLNLSGNDGMATAGSGDVLSGVIGGLMAQGMSAAEAASLGAYLHGCAGDASRRKCGKRSLMASDIIEGLHIVLREQE